MRRVPASSIFRCDYTDLDAVIDLAKRMGKGMTVYKHPDRDNYNITHTSRKDQYQLEWVKHQK